MSSSVRISSTASFGNRRLPGQVNEEKSQQQHATEDDVVWEYNAWDMVEPPASHFQFVEERIQLHRSNPVPMEKQQEYKQEADKFWDVFYQKNDNKFFKDRKWLRIEFPELFSHEGSGEKKYIWEVGCGVGNTIFPLLQEFVDTPEQLFIYGCDFSSTAIDIVKNHEEYNSDRCCAFVHDLIDEALPKEIPLASLDVITCIFCLSAIPPNLHSHVLEKFNKLLKPGGIILFRDYGRGDLTQVRFKRSRWMGENWYIRGDGTQVYFFEPTEITRLFDKAGFDELDLATDRRMLVNRLEKKKMFRVWLQGKYRKRG